MTETEKQELSKAVAEKHGINPPSDYLPEANVQIGMTERWGKTAHGDDLILGWLHDDSARCFDLFAEHEIDIMNYGNWVMAVGFGGDFSEYTKNHNNDKAMTARIAGLRALIEAKD